MARASAAVDLVDAKTGFARARKTDGSFRAPFDPASAGYGSDNTEGIAWQNAWYEPQDVAGLIGAPGGDDRLIAKRDAVFESTGDPKSFANVEDISGLIGYFAHGNEPSHHIAYLGGRVTLNGKPWPRTWIGYADITAGGEFRFAMQATPDKAWGADRAARPYSMSTAH